ncbi:MAG TPA: GIY-YIG nuclease family protein [Flavobacterium sp.]|nr:GIY-YIG nuclease family protein [Flavobacterium sp.]
MFSIYIIFSEKLNRFYVGTTDDVERRVSEHNTGFYSNSYTSKGIPWILKLKFECKSSEQAYALERFIKKMKSKTFISNLINDENIIKDIQNKL